MAESLPTLLGRPKLQLRRTLPATCDDCGEMLASGTFGIIYASKQDPGKVIKGTIKPLDKGCPQSFSHEYNMARRVSGLLNAFKNTTWYRRTFGNRDIIETIHPEKLRVERGHCFYTMEKLLPIEPEGCLMELLPGAEESQMTTGAIRSAPGRWRQCGRSEVNEILRRLDIDPNEWADFVGRFLGYCHAHGVILNDVEFQVGRLGPNRPARIVLLDFDKVYEQHPSTFRTFPDRFTFRPFPTANPVFQRAYRESLTRHTPSAAKRSASASKRRAVHAARTRSKSVL